MITNGLGTGREGRYHLGVGRMTSGTRRFLHLLFSAALAGVVVATLVLTPAGAHVGGTVAHLWTDHIRPLADSRYVKAAQLRTGYVSCAGSAFQEEISSYSYSTGFGGLRFVTAGLGGEFHCNAALPQGAKVTAVRFTVLDSSNTEWIDCHLWRNNLATGTVSMMASSATNSLATPGLIRLSDTSIGNATINNRDFAYIVACVINGTGEDIGLFGASTKYTITGAKGAAS